MPSQIEHVVRAIRRSAVDFESSLADLIRIPSVSSIPANAPDVERAAQSLARFCRGIGFPEVRIVETAGHPSVVCSWLRPGKPVALVYGHYDVQPAPAERWTSDPFEPVRRGAWLYGRGASDDKGQLLAHLAAVAAWAKVAGAPPVGVVVVVDGEEEIGSPHLAPLISSIAPIVDAAVVSDMTMPSMGRPALTETLRGKVAMTITVSNRGVDAHSGLFGGAVADPVAWLCSTLAGIHNPAGGITIDGFYEQVFRPPPGPVLGRTSATISAGAGGASLWPEAGVSPDEATTTRPSVVVSSMSGGSERSAASIVPASATARLDIRLVAEQRPQRVADLVRRHVRGRTPTEFNVVVEQTVGANPAVFDRNHPVSHAAERALEATFGRRPVWVRSGGSIPVASHLHQLGVPTILVGFGLPSGRVHGPDERAHLPTLLAGSEFSARWLAELEEWSLRTDRHYTGRHSAPSEVKRRSNP